MQHPFPYEVIYSDRKSLAIQITAQATVRVRVPKNCPAPTIALRKASLDPKASGLGISAS